MRRLEKLQPFGLLLLRLGLGAIFIYHGYPKLFGHTHEFVQQFERLGLPGYFAYFSGVIELFGGSMLVAGLYTRIAGLAIAIEMAVGIWRVGRFTANPFAVHTYETPMALAVAAFALATLGAGLISLDHALFHEGAAGPARPSRKPKKA
jgi:putative oxidoreductase